MTAQPVGPSSPATHEALWPADLFLQGVDWILVARFKSGGRRLEAAIFLVDVFCLGAKLAIHEDCHVQDYRQRVRNHYKTSFLMEAVEPWCARQLVEQAVAYARGLGFHPHRDYDSASRVFAGLPNRECPRQFTFGHQGKPFYRRGPRETEERARRIVTHLQQHCGPGNFDYLVPLGQAQDISRALES